MDSKYVKYVLGLVSFPFQVNNFDMMGKSDVHQTRRR